jgi:hypothetical protein
VSQGKVTLTLKEIEECKRLLETEEEKNARQAELLARRALNTQEPMNRKQRRRQAALKRKSK